MRSENHALIAPLVQARGLHYTYPDGTSALRGIDLEIHRGDFVAIIGENGSGKTTLVKHFNGLLKSTEGNVSVMGIDTRNATIAELSTRVGYVFQNPDDQICTSRVKEEVAFGAKNLGLPRDEIVRRSEKAMKETGIYHLKDQHPLYLGKGERQRVAVASILAMQPEVLIVDEPTTGQDRRQSRQMMDMTRQLYSQGYTVIIITHDMRLVADYAKRVVVLCNGKVLFDGSPADAFSRPEKIRESALQPPQITQLAQMLRDFGFPPDILNAEQMYVAFKGIYARSRGI